MLENYYAVIMAGGGGTRLWPMSRRSNPKQMLKLNGKQTLFQMAVERLQGLFPPERILIVTVAEQAAQLQEQAPAIPHENYLLEPMPRGTASVVGLAAVHIQHKDPGATMAVLTSDHFIEDVDYFMRLLRSGYELAQEGPLVTLGIQPTYAATGYGYIQRGELLGQYRGNPAYRVVRFVEKPNQALAEELVQRGDHDWNSGMFVWRVDRILEEFTKYMPALKGILDEIYAGYRIGAHGRAIERVWPTIEPQTIDYGIMEKSEHVAVLSAHALGWNDVGAWVSLFEVLDLDDNGNVILGANHLGLETEASLIASEQGDRLLVTIGVQDLIVVDTGKVLLVCNRSHAQKVRQVVDLLKNSGRQDLL